MKFMRALLLPYRTPRHYYAAIIFIIYHAAIKRLTPRHFHARCRHAMPDDAATPAAAA